MLLSPDMHTNVCVSGDNSMLMFRYRVSTGRLHTAKTFIRAVNRKVFRTASKAYDETFCEIVNDS